MQARDWTLVFFTVFTQMAVGCFVVLSVVHAVAVRTAGAEAAAASLRAPLFGAFVVMAFGLLVSLLHLGHPLRAYLALFNVRASWVSREVWLALLFSAAAAAFLVGLHGGVGPRILDAMAASAILLGLAFVASMSAIYRLPAQPAWNRASTPLSFFATTLVLGLLGAGTALALTSGGSVQEAHAGLIRAAVLGTTGLSLLVLGVVLVLIPFQAAPVGGPATLWLLALRGALAVSAAVLVALFLHAAAREPATASLPVAVVSAGFLLLVTSEMAGRALFYASKERWVIGS
jgi:anaerobic dimethyl sulfoxide reductase subunit C